MTNNFTQAWDEVNSNHSRKMFSTMDSKYWIESGVKIEKKFGKITIDVGLLPGDAFSKPNTFQTATFEKYGWDAGVSHVNMDYFRSLVDICEKRERNATNDKDREKAHAKFLSHTETHNEFRNKYYKMLFPQE